MLPVLSARQPHIALSPTATIYNYPKPTLITSPTDPRHIIDSVLASILPP